MQLAGVVAVGWLDCAQPVHHGADLIRRQALAVVAHAAGDVEGGGILLCNEGQGCATSRWELCQHACGRVHIALCALGTMR